jgi:hypothetical protein
MIAERFVNAPLNAASRISFYFEGSFAGCGSASKMGRPFLLLWFDTIFFTGVFVFPAHSSRSW